MPAEPLDDTLVRLQETALRAVAPHAETTDQHARWPAEGLRALLDARLGGLVLPESVGGLGHGLFGTLRATETLGQHCASAAMCFGMHVVGSAVLAAKATPHQARGVLEPIARGRHLTTLAASEPGTGSLFYVPQTRVRRSGEGYLVNGTKSFVTNGSHAHSYVITGASEDADAGPGQFSCFLLPADAPGLSWKEDWQGVGMRGNSSRTMRLDDVPLPREALLGDEGDQTWYVFHVIAPYFLVAMAGTYIGLSQAALDAARDHLRERRHGHSGLALSANPILQHRLGGLWAALERARRLCYYAAEQGETNGPDAMPALLSAKAEAAEMAVRLTNECMTLLGGLGYAQGGRLDRHLRDARAGPVMAPTTDILRTWTGRWLLGEPLLSG
ncbi:MAG TPA: acyl-CoA dehydrogenase family protein [Candidatus Thermoplasmatota archaeon]|nr:acyl-CoA dehydrogenase family protein [Candidatus Thermoplasmatota archaeon]